MVAFILPYSTQDFGINDSMVCRIISRLSARIVAIKKNRELSYEETAQLIDVTEHKKTTQEAIKLMW